MKNYLREKSQVIKFLLLVIGIFAVASTVYAWAGPPYGGTCTTQPCPPNGNVPAPINVGADSQVKSGGLGVGSLSTGGSISIGNNLYFSASNPTISAPSYFIVPGGAYFNGGTVYTEAPIQARGGIHNDTGTNLVLSGGSSGNTYITGSVGIGTASPTQKLDVVGNVKASTGFCIGTSCITSWPAGATSQWTSAGSNIYYNGGNIGIGTSNPTSPIMVVSSGAVAGDLKMSSPSTNVTSGVGQVLTVANLNATAGNYAAMTFFDANNFLQGSIGMMYGTHSGMNQGTFYIEPRIVATPSSFVVAPSGRVGIGTVSPTEKLDVAGSIQTLGATAGSNRVVLKDTSGSPRSWEWYPQASGPNTLGLFERVSGVTSLTVVAPTGNVGVGTASPTQKLDVVGNVKASTGFCIGTSCITSWPSGGGAEADTLQSVVSRGNTFSGALVDADNSNYSIDPTGTSNFIIIGADRLIARDNGNSNLYLLTAAGGLPGYPSSYYPTLKTDGPWIYLSAQGTYSGYFGDSGMRARAFYDFDKDTYYVDPYGTSKTYALYRDYGFNTTEYDITNSAYYLDPSGSSNLNVLTLADYPTVGGGGTGLYGWGLGSASWPPRIGGYSPYTFNYHTGLAFSANSSYGGLRFYNQGYPDISTSNLAMQITNNNVYLNTLCIAGDCKSAWPSGGTSQWTTTGSNIYYNSGNVGVGTTAPGEKLDVAGGIQTQGATAGSNRLILKDISGNPRTWEWYPQASGPNTLGLFERVSGVTSLTVAAPSGNVGIGTASPTQKLH